MSGALSILLVGLLLGIKHAAEADHLAAVATLAAGQKSLAQTVRLGIAWGIGHSATLLLIGSLVLCLETSIPPRLEQALELAVSLMLVALGADVLRRLRVRQMHFHVHVHADGARHMHLHAHAGEDVSHHASPHAHPHPVNTPWRALAVGTMHGMAGSAALIALGLTAASSWTMGLLYIAVFGIGSIIGMAMLSIVISIPLRWSSARFGRFLNQGLTGLVGAFSCALGAFMFYRIGIVEGLLSNVL